MLPWLQLWVGSRLCLDASHSPPLKPTSSANSNFGTFRILSLSGSHLTQAIPITVGRMWQSSSLASCKILLFYYYIIDISQSLVAKSQPVLETAAFLFWPKTQKIKKHQLESAWKPKMLGNCWAVDIFWVIMRIVNDVCCWVNYIF